MQLNTAQATDLYIHRIGISFNFFAYPCWQSTYLSYTLERQRRNDNLCFFFHFVQRYCGTTLEKFSRCKTIASSFCIIMIIGHIKESGYEQYQGINMTLNQACLLYGCISFTLNYIIRKWVIWITPTWSLQCLRVLKQLQPRFLCLMALAHLNH